MTQHEEVARNFESFKVLLPDVIDAQRGRFALMRDAKILDFFDAARDAFLTGRARFEDGIFSIQEVTDTQVDLGYFSHAVPGSTV